MGVQMLFRKIRKRDEVKEWLGTADPKEIAEEKAALTREDAEAHGGLPKPALPTDIGVELIGKSRFAQWISPALKPTDSGFKLRGMPEVQEPEKPLD